MAAIGRAVIVGAGVGGLTTALALQRQGIEVEVHERYAHRQSRATGFTIWSYAVRHLLDLGVSAEGLDRAGSRVRRTDIRNERGDLLESMPVGEVSDRLGAPTYDISRSELLECLRDAIGPGVVHDGSEAVGVEGGETSATVLLAGGGRAAGDLVVACDGVHSTLREHVAGPARLRYSGYAGWGALTPFRHADMPAGHHVEIWARGSKGGVADVGGGMVRWYALTRAPAGTLTPDRTAAREHVRDWYGLLGAAIDATDPDAVVTMEAWDMEPLERWHRGRVVLLGDSAHATTPFAAMGACMTVRDAVTLAGRLGSGDAVEAALAAYEADRKAVDEGVVRHGRTMGHVSQVHSPILAWVRDEAFRHMPPNRIEQVAMEMAAGAEA